jgi:hypothetical protein
VYGWRRRSAGWLQRSRKGFAGQLGPGLASLGLVCSCLLHPVGYCTGAVEAVPSGMAALSLSPFRCTILLPLGLVLVTTVRRRG